MIHLNGLCSRAQIIPWSKFSRTDRDATLGLAKMCIRVGQGIAVIFERT
jgi:acetyl-CoA acetyltransferase